MGGGKRGAGRKIREDTSPDFDIITLLMNGSATANRSNPDENQIPGGFLSDSAAKNKTDSHRCCILTSCLQCTHQATVVGLAAAFASPTRTQPTVRAEPPFSQRDVISRGASIEQSSAHFDPCRHPIAASLLLNKRKNGREIFKGTATSNSLSLSPNRH